MWLKELCLVVLISVASVAAKDRNRKPFKVVCYLGSWANYRQGDGKFQIEHIDPNLCTHLIYGFAKLANNRIAAYDPYLDLKENWGLGAFDRFNGLKKANPQLSTMIAIGGWNEGSTKYSQMAGNPSARATFVKSCVDFCLKYGFDGVDIDWEYPANRGGAAYDKQNFVILLKELKEAFTPRGLLLSAAVSAGKATMDTAYDIPEVAKYLDFINVMAYDFHGSWEKVTGHNAPLYARDEESENEKTLNVKYGIDYWVRNGAPRSKIILGMGLYGRSFTLANPSANEMDINQRWKEVFVDNIESPYSENGNQKKYPIDNWVRNGTIKSKDYGFFARRDMGLYGRSFPQANPSTNGIGAPTTGPGNAGPMTKQPGMLGYNEICLNVKQGWKEVFVARIEAPYATNGNQWVGYDNIQSIGIKVDYLKKEGLGGGMVWSLETDDFRGKCGAGKYPLLSKIASMLNGDSPGPNPGPKTTKPPRPTQPPPPTQRPGKHFKCTRNGFFRDPNNCSVFYRCIKRGRYYAKHTFKCGGGTVFDEKITTCNFRNRVPGCQP